MLDKINKDVYNQMDMLFFLRRFRMHGFALYTLMNKFDRAQVGAMAAKKPVNMIREFSRDVGDKKKSLFDGFEHLSIREKLQLHLYERFKRIVARENKQEAQGN